MEIVGYLKELYTNTTAKDIYIVAITLISLFFIFKAMYNKIKYICLEKASEKIASVEKLTELTGEEKFALVLCWINTDLPKIFNNAAMQTLIEKIINIAYNNSFKYAQNYIKRKTGHDISELLETIKSISEDVKNDVSAEGEEK